MDSTQKLDSANVQGLPLLSNTGTKGISGALQCSIYDLCRTADTILWKHHLQCHHFDPGTKPNWTDRPTESGWRGHEAHKFHQNNKTIYSSLVTKVWLGAVRYIEISCQTTSTIKWKNRRGKQIAAETHKLVYSFAQHFFLKDPASCWLFIWFSRSGWQKGVLLTGHKSAKRAARPSTDWCCCNISEERKSVTTLEPQKLMGYFFPHFSED